ncbi:hypothetical protein QN277_008472 [Acacia crassicarpa]|uniref:Cell wall protein n=1 Tax=Acacia crassicarpa TaxID=499986 RepID=A0AAE1M874_9FABA|nr:hypothetical protein QN277_008472 [Acacia crassicarpa]
MAYKYTSSFLALVLVSNVLLATGRYIPVHVNSQTQDMKEPEWFFDSGGHAYVPGIGRVELPPKFKFPYYYPYIGGGIGAGSGPTGSGYGPGGGGVGAGSGPTGGGYVPGGDDTFVPNPGYEVPYPGTGGGGAPGAPAFP